MKAKSICYQDSPLQLVAFNDVEDELFGAPGTPDRAEYEARVSFNGQPLAQPLLAQADVVKGGTLEFVMGARPIVKANSE